MNTDLVNQSMNVFVPQTNTADNTLLDPYQWWRPGPPVYPHVCPQPTVITYRVEAQPRCAWCQGTHYGGCARLKSVTYRKDGTVERVEFFEEES
jgi:hypothetical protein